MSLNLFFAEAISVTELDAELESRSPLRWGGARMNGRITLSEVAVERNSDTDAVERDRVRALICFSNARSHGPVKINNVMILVRSFIGLLSM